MTTTKPNMHAVAINPAAWPRQTYFYYFTKIAPSGFSLTVNMDITATLAWTKAHHVKFNAVYLYLVSRLLTTHPEMRIGYLNDQLVTFDVLHPSYTILHADRTMANLWTTYDTDFETFYQHYLADQAEFSALPGPMPKTPQTPNLVNIGCLPGVHFSSYTPLPFKPLDSFFPIFQAGQFKKDADKTIMPLSITVNHATIDGDHLSRFFNELQSCWEQPNTILSLTI
ncbi:chloramphenicol acetyltransferase [Lactiplantibacillus plantarum]|uniref:chloramphenicol acetyltransferase n=1 Tax=Lactiplantibacillus plantarum TaxID=1590 RepID=UPI000CDDE442|nr:chloramphenicol acetyltransferase [Lactiplantibacillus plantarum]